MLSRLVRCSRLLRPAVYPMRVVAVSAPTASRRLALFSSDAHGHAHAAAEAKHNDAHHAGASAHGDHHHDHHHDHHGHHEEHHHEEHHHAPEFVKDPNVLYLSREEVARHNTENDCWIIVHGKVYNVTTWVPFHPGRKAILTNAGHDSTALFEGYGHGMNARNLMDEFYVGEVEPTEHKPRYTGL